MLNLKQEFGKMSQIIPVLWHDTEFVGVKIKLHKNVNSNLVSFFSSVLHSNPISVTLNQMAVQLSHVTSLHLGNKTHIQNS